MTSRDRVVIKTTLPELERAQGLVEQSRGAAIRVPRALLINLLMDHSTMTRRLEEAGYRVGAVTGEEQPARIRTRPRARRRSR